MKPKREWKIVKSFPDGHTYFTTHTDPEKRFVADQSGRNPDETEDGPMFIDKDRGLEASWRHVSLAVIKASDQGRYTTPVGFDEALWLAHYLGVPIKALRGEFTVTLTKCGD